MRDLAAAAGTMPTRATPAPGGKRTEPRSPSRSRGDGGHRLAAAFEAVEHLPALAESKRRLHRLVASPNPPAGEIVDVLEADVALALAVMRAANSGAAAGRGAVSGIPQAVEVLNPTGVAEVTKEVETYEMFEPGNGWRGLPDRFRGHAVATRAAIERVGDMARLPGHDELSVVALLHDVGKLVIARLHPSFEQTGTSVDVVPEERVRSELRELGIEHALVGGVLSRRWGLPDVIARGIERHHSPDAQGVEAAVRLADMIAHHAHGGAISGDSVAEASQALGLKPAQVRKLFYEYPYAPSARRRTSEPCPLSARELDALRGLGEGKVYKEIAGEMSLSASTVRTHLHNVYRKIGAVDRAQAVLVAHERGWI
jgi:HD-like signal output (HDOD) protein/DNA-binding CsgD family transcriptional regulator